MKQTSKTLIFFGNERLSTGFVPSGAPTLQALIDNGYDIKAVVSHYSPATSRKARTLEVQEVAERHSIPVLLPQKLRDIKDELTSFGAEAGVLIAFGKLIPQDIIDIFPKGIINIHPSLLPLYRGSTPIETAMLNGDRHTGVSLMKLVKEMDAGPVWAQTTVTIEDKETKQHLTEKLLQTGAEMLIMHLPSILGGKLQPHQQNDALASYTQLISKSDGQLNPSTYSASELERRVRAYAAWPKAKLTLGDIDIIVLKSHVVASRNEKRLCVPCAHNSFLEIDELITPNGKRMSGEAFLRGYAIAPAAK